MERIYKRNWRVISFDCNTLTNADSADMDKIKALGEDWERELPYR